MNRLDCASNILVVALHMETSDLPYLGNPVQLSASLYMLSGDPVFETRFILNPQTDISVGASRTHGIYRHVVNESSTEVSNMRNYLEDVFNSFTNNGWEILPICWDLPELIWNCNRIFHGFSPQYLLDLPCLNIADSFVDVKQIVKHRLISETCVSIEDMKYNLSIPKVLENVFQTRVDTGVKQYTDMYGRTIPGRDMSRHLHTLYRMLIIEGK